MIKKIITSILVLLSIHFIQAQVQIQNVSSTASNCPNSGSISVDATGPGSLVYSIIDGPSTQSEQPSSSFASLPPGTYTVQVRSMLDNSQDQETVTISGNYNALNFTGIPTYPSCNGASDGSIQLNRSVSTGFGPFSWEITSPAAHATGPQSSDVFENLPAGTYSIRLSDACGSSTNQTVELVDDNDPISFFSPRVRFTGCGEGEVSVNVYHNGLRPPYTMETTVNGANTTTTTDVDIEELTGNIISIEHQVTGISYGDNISITVSDACGRSYTEAFEVAELDFCIRHRNTVADCDFVSIVTYGNRLFCLDDDEARFSMPFPATYTFTDLNTMTVVETGTIDPTDDSFIDELTLEPVPGGDYELSLTDACGNEYNGDYSFTQPNHGPPAVNNLTKSASNCQDRMARVGLSARNFSSEPFLIITDGPDLVTNDNPGYEYDFEGSYPDTITNPSRSLNNPQYGFDFENVAIGEYTYVMADSCGNEIEGSFEVTSDDVNNYEHDISYIRGCEGTNDIIFQTNASSGRLSVFNSNLNITRRRIIEDRDTMENLPSGTYRVTYSHSGGGEHLFGNSCHLTADTIIIQGYSQPEIHSYNAILCDDDVIAELIPDTTSGIPPYQYELYDGPQTFPYQDDNLFSLDDPGIYQARIIDSCGNTGTRQISLVDLEFEPTSYQVSCTSARVIYPTSDYYSYEWTSPDGSTFNGDTLIIDPITPADTGLWRVTQTVSISGCSEQFENTHQIDAVSTHEFSDEICPGTSYDFNGTLYTEEDTYIDTLTTLSGCDSIVTLHLEELDYLEGFYESSVCPNDTTFINGKAYTAPGVYNDTLSTAGCDSILTIEIQEVPFLTGEVNERICPGASVNINGKQYDTSGVWYDTLSTSACDSIVTITVEFSPVPSPSFGEDTVICQGERLLLDAGSGQVSHEFFNADGFISNAQTISVNQIGWYGLEVTNQYSCTATDTIHLLDIINAPTADIIGNEDVCQGDSVTLQASGGERYFWEPIMESGEMIHVTPTQTTTYTVTAYNEYDCPSDPATHLVQVNEPSEEPLLLSEHVKHCFHEGPLEMEVEWGNNVYWPELNHYQPYVMIEEGGHYHVQAEDQSGCLLEEEVYIEPNCEPQIFIPETFTPNRDGVHDEFEVFGKYFSHFEMRIFNRWGEVIFLTHDPNESWDGTFKGEMMPVSTYPWVIQYKSMYTEQDGGGYQGERRLTGSVTLIR